jgi:multidrug resistance efflux pump
MVYAAVWLGLLVLIGSVGVAGLAGTRADGPATPVERTRLEKRAVAVAYVDVEGGVRNLYPARPGRVVEVLAREGQEVPAGAPLLRVDDTLAQAQVAEAKIDLAAAQERLTQARRLSVQHQKQVAAQQEAVTVARRDVDKAKAIAGKARRLAKDRAGVTSEDVKVTEAEVAKAEAAVRAQQAKLELIESADSSAAVRLAELDVRAKHKQQDKALYGLKECTVVAPEKGAVLRTLARAGEVLGPNPQQPALIFCPSKPRIVRAEVEQEFAGTIVLGQKASIVDYATSKGEWRGKVTRVSAWYTQRRSPIQEPLQFNDVRTLEVIIQLTGGKQPLRIGQRVLVTLDGGS